MNKVHRALIPWILPFLLSLLCLINPNLDFVSHSNYNWPPQVWMQFSSVQSLSRVRLFATPWTAARQASPSRFLKPHMLSNPACVHAKSLQSCPTLCHLWTVAPQAPLSMGFSRKEYWSGLPCPPPENLSDPGIEPTSLASPALAGGFFTTSASWEAPNPAYTVFSYTYLTMIKFNLC